MTESEWLACTDPELMMQLKGTASERKYRLWVCAYASWHAMGLDNPMPLMAAIRAAEKWADGDCSVGLGEHSKFLVCYESAQKAAHLLAQGVANYSDSTHKQRTTRLLLDNIRCVFGNPFRPIAVKPKWLTPSVIGLAHSMYDSREFGGMPVLADALQDAGCEDPNVLSHCQLEDVGLYSADVTIPYRLGGPHVRGCSVVDMVMGKG